MRAYKTNKTVAPMGAAIEKLVQRTVGHRGRVHVTGSRISSLGDDEVVVVVVGKHDAIAHRVRRPAGPVKVRDLEVGAKAGALAMEQLSPRRADVAALELTEPERGLMREGGFEEPPADAKLASDDGALEYLQLLRDSASPEQAATLLGVNASRIRQRLGARQLFGIKEGRAWRLPRFQFAGRRLVPGIDKVLAALPAGLHAVAVDRWFRSPHPDLETREGTVLTPLEWLLRGYDASEIEGLAALL